MLIAFLKLAAVILGTVVAVPVSLVAPIHSSAPMSLQANGSGGWPRTDRQPW